ncbi:hypothetical protein [Caulobacter vibrioides]|uniref:Scaffolding protein n=1 Tax=Caulobacter phage S2B TaxID=2759120 RepID=A0AAE7ML62_9CAUD|nr:hypothetical protein [Caulobacter vibrioides]QOC54141.1 hypothetical protein [Caulobacter phage S2B]QXZ50185.1 hypothetical protein KZH45_09640 [Caulobacter vibrioides]
MSVAAPAAPSAAPSIPAEALPPGVDAAAYVAQHTSQTGLPEPALATPAASQVPPKPDHVPAKFYDAATGKVDYDALARSYSALESKLGAPKADEAPAAPAADEATPDGVEVKRPEAPAEEAPAPEGNSEVVTAINAVAEKYAAGTLEAADVADLSKKTGLPEANLQLYFEGLRAIETLRTLEAHEAAGGKDVFTAAQKWAGESLTDAELEFYNSSVANPKTAKSAIEWLVQKYNGANPSEGTLLTPGPAPAASGDVFNSLEEMRSAISAPEYQRDPAVRQAVAEKIARSKQAGTLSTGGQYFSRTF